MMVPSWYFTFEQIRVVCRGDADRKRWLALFINQGFIFNPANGEFPGAFSFFKFYSPDEDLDSPEVEFHQFPFFISTYYFQSYLE